MSYRYETSKTARRYTDRLRTPRSITIHHWGSLGSSFDGIVNWFCAPDTSAQTSAHYVVQGADANGKPNPRVACIVDPDKIAWHAGDWDANVSSIGIECRTEASSADIAVVVELIRKLRSVYGDLPLYPHKHWASTACPGRYSVATLDRLARAAQPPSTPTPAPTPPPSTPTPAPPKEDDMPTPKDLWNADLIPAPDPADKENPTWAPSSYLRYTYLNARNAAHAMPVLQGQLAGLVKAVQQLASQQGVDPTAVLEAAEAGARAGAEAAIRELDAQEVAGQ